MKSKFNTKLLVFVLALCFGVWFSLPNFINFPGPKMTLGLDLQGGLNMLLGVKTEEAVKARFGTIASGINYYSNDEQILIDGLKNTDNSVLFELLDLNEKPKMDKYLSEIKGSQITENNGKYEIKLNEEEQKEIASFALRQAIENIRNRLDQFGLSEPNVAKQGEDAILVQLPGIKNQEEEQRALELISKGAHLQMMAVDEARAARVDVMSDLEAENFGDVILPYVNDPRQKILLKAIPILDGEMLTDARVAYDQNGQPVINFTLNAQGGRIFGDFSGKNVGNRMAVVLDGKVYSAPVIRERIGGGSGQISGGFSVEEASDIAIALRSGALPAPILLLEKRSVGPSLGADSIKASLIALIAGAIAVMLFMIFYYGVAGLIADFALIVNILLLISTMSLFGATLTLPGMAGIILTIGMAVDANVIINERIREGFRAGEPFVRSMEDGYENASRAIFDANLTGILANVLLYAFGTGAIKGFAITATIGIIASIITGIIGTHGIFRALQNTITKSGKYGFWFGYSAYKPRTRRVFSANNKEQTKQDSIESNTANTAQISTRG